MKMTITSLQNRIVHGSLRYGLLLILALLAAQPAWSIGGMAKSYCRVPAFLQSSVNLDPNILILIDSSGSMNWEAYLTHNNDNGAGANVLTAGDSYYGIFTENRCYRYDYTNKWFTDIGPTRADFSCNQLLYSNTFSGSFLNLASGTRLEIVKKVFTGGLWYNNFLWGDPAGHFRYGCWQPYKIEVPQDFMPGGNAQTVTSIRRYTGNGSCWSYYSPNFYSTFTVNGAATLHMTFFEAAVPVCTMQNVTTANVRQDACAGTTSACVSSHTAASCALCSPAITPPGDSCTMAGGGYTYTCTKYKSNTHMECGNGACAKRAGGACPGSMTFPLNEVCLSTCRKASISGSPGTATCSYSPPLCDCTVPTLVCGGGTGVTRNANFVLRIQQAADPWDGLIQDAYSKGRWSIFTFDLNGSEGARMATPMGDTLDNTVASIRTVIARTATPLAESLYTTLLYYGQQQPSPYHPGADYPLNNNGPQDPLYELSAGKAVSCRDNNILVLTDGEPTADGNKIPVSVGGADNDGIGATASFASVSSWWPPSNHPEWLPGNWGSYTGDWYDDVAFWGHTADMRPDLPGLQNVSIYSVYAFGTGAYARFLMWEAGKNGIFQDTNGNGTPDSTLPEEWDMDGNGDPDGFYIAENGNQLKDQLRAAFAAILERSSSVAPLSYLGASGTGQGIATQAFFNPLLVSPHATDVKTTWAGFLRSFWVDQGGFMREDSNPNQRLDLDGTYPGGYDAMIQFRYDPKSSKTFVDLYNNGPDPLNPIANPTTVDTAKDIQDLIGVYDFGLQLATLDPLYRRIYTTYNNARVNFDLPLAPPLLAAGKFGDNITTMTDAELLIAYIRGEDIPGMRPRLYVSPNEGPLTWKLGDSINTTTRFIGPPTQKFFPEKFADTVAAKVEVLRDSYAPHVSAHAEDPLMAYTGANDGMMHAFGMGRVRSDGKGLVFEDDPKMPAGLVRGDEMWAWIPEAALPHLNWLTEDQYCHVYFIDGTTQVYDLNIFSPDTLHKNGWGKLMAISLGLGCPTYHSIYGMTFYPTYVFLDITDPYNPAYYGSFSDPNLGFAYFEPVIVDYWEGAQWKHKMVIFGGPDNDSEILRTSQNYMWVFSLPFEGVGTFGVQNKIALPATLGTVTAIGGAVADLNEKEFGKLTSVAGWPDSGNAWSDNDKESDNIYVGGYRPNNSGGYDGVIFAVDLKSGRGFGTSIAATPSAWRIRPLAQFPGMPVQGMTFPYSAPVIVSLTGRSNTLNDMNNVDTQGVVLTLDPCFSGETATRSGINCSSFQISSIASFVDMSDFTYDVKTGATTCGSFAPCTDAGIMTATLTNFGTKFFFTGSGERGVGEISSYNGINIFSTYSPVSTGICSFGGTSNVYALKMFADGKSAPGLYNLIAGLGTGQVTVGPTINGRTLLQDSTGVAQIIELLPKFAGPFFGFGALEFAQ